MKVAERSISSLVTPIVASHFTEGMADLHFLQNVHSRGIALLVGAPGARKSGFALQAALDRGANGSKSLMLLSEESVARVRERAHGMVVGLNGAVAQRALKNVAMEQLDVDPRSLATAVRHLVLGGNAPHRDVELVVLDSIQGGGVPTGSDLAACRAAIDVAKALQSAGIATLLIGHVTKQNQVRGPRTLEHAVDVVVHLEFKGGRRSLTVPKNRFGPAVLRPVPLVIDAVTTRLRRVPHTAARVATVDAWIPGTGLVEVQAAAALSSQTVPSNLGRISVCRGVPRYEAHYVMRCLSTTLGFDRILADLEFSVSCRAAADDGTAADGVPLFRSGLLHLPLGLAIVGACLGRPVAANLLAVGEIDLGGHARPLPTSVTTAVAMALRADALRGRRLVLPAGDAKFLPWNCGCELYGVGTLAAAVGRAWHDLDVKLLPVNA